MKMGSFLGWFVGLVVLVQDIFVLPWLLLLVQYKICFPHCTLFQFFVLIGQQAGQAAELGRLSLSMCLWVFPGPGLL